MNIQIFLITLLALAFVSCAPQTRHYVPKHGSLGYSNQHRVLIVGENVEPSIAEYYQKKYDILVWFTPYRGDMKNFTNNLWESGIGPSVPIRSLIVELKSINHTMGKWQIYVPRIAEKYFIRTLKHMGSGSLSKARGAVVLIDSQYVPDIENEVRRVTQGSFFVEYEAARD